MRPPRTAAIKIVSSALENPMKTTLLALAAFTIAGSALAQTAAPAKHKVVLQMNVADNDSWNQLLGNIGNVQTAFKNDGGVQIEVVFYGKGLSALLKTNTMFEERLKKAAADGVIL